MGCGQNGGFLKSNYLFGAGIHSFGKLGCGGVQEGKGDEDLC